MSLVHARVDKLPILISLVFAGLLSILFIKLIPLAEFNPIFILATPLLCVLFIGVMLKPKWVLVGLIFTRTLMDPMLNASKAGSSLGFGAVVNILVILIPIFLVLKDRSVPILRSAFLKKWIFFLIVCLITVVSSPHPLMGIKVFFNLLSYLCMALLPSLIDPQKNDKKFWIKILILSSILPVVFANLDLARGGVPMADSANRIQGTFTHPNILGFYLVWVMMLVLYIFKSGLLRLSYFKKFLLLLYGLNLTVLLVATKTRNAWICAWLLLFLYGLFKERRYIYYSLGILIFGFFLSGVASRVTDLFVHNTSRENSFAWRLDVWKDSLGSIMEKWMLGHGLGSFRELSRNFLIENKKGAEAHSVYIQLLFETGIVGLFAYLSIYWNLFREFYWRFKKSVLGLRAEFAIVIIYLIVYLVSGLGDNMLYYLTLNWYCWFFIGVVLKSVRFQRLVAI